MPTWLSSVPSPYCVAVGAKQQAGHPCSRGRCLQGEWLQPMSCSQEASEGDMSRAHQGAGLGTGRRQGAEEVLSWLPCQLPSRCWG